MSKEATSISLLMKKFAFGGNRMLSKGRCTNSCKQLIIPHMSESDAYRAKFRMKFPTTKVLIPEDTEVVDAVRVCSAGVSGICGGMFIKIAVPLGIEAPVAAETNPLLKTT